MTDLVKQALSTSPELKAAYDAGESIQVVGTTEAFTSGRTPVFREMTIDDLVDDCPACAANRKLIEAGNPPMALVYT